MKTRNAILLFIIGSLLVPLASFGADWTVKNATQTRITGLGVEFDPHFLTQNVASNNGTREEDWENVIIRRLRAMQVQKLRVMILPSWYEPKNDNDNPHTTELSQMQFRSPEMKELCRLLDVAQHDGISVTLTFWGVRPATFMLPAHYDGWLFGPSEMEEWAENVTSCLRFLLKEQGYTCIHEITPVNEPDWSFPPENASRLERYVRMCKVLDARLRQEGLRKLVRLNLSDNSDGGSGTHDFLEGCTQELSHIADVFNSHTYIFGYDTPNSRILDWERENVRLASLAGKAHFIGEYGSNQTVGATQQRDINRFDRGILMARIVINLLNAGCSGASYWSLLDQYYSRDEANRKANMQQLGLWKYLKKEYINDSIYTSIQSDYEVRPQYFAVGMLTRFVRSKAEVYPLQTGNDWIAATALRASDGKWTYLISNPLPQEKVIQLRNPKLKEGERLSYYEYSTQTLSVNDGMIGASDTLTTDKGFTSITIPPRSFIALRQE